MTNKEKINFIDTFLMYQEDTLKGKEGNDCTLCRKYLEDLEKML